MGKVHIYGIKNCNTMKKTFDWFDENGIEYEFHDYKKGGFDEGIFNKAIKTHGWNAVINTRGMTWRKVEDDVKSSINDNNAVELAACKTSVIKRPMIVTNDDILLGFDVDTLTKTFS